MIIDKAEIPPPVHRKAIDHDERYIVKLRLPGNEPDSPKLYGRK
jgi:hypothetical protein